MLILLKNLLMVIICVVCLCFASFLSGSYEECRTTADWLLKHTQVRPTVGIVCGSGLSALGDMLKDPQVFKYCDIPNFPHSTGMSSKGRRKKTPVNTCM